MFGSSTYRITRLPHTYGYATLSGANVSKLYLQNHWATLHFWVRYLKCSLGLSTLPRGLVGYTTLISAYLIAAYVSKLYLQNHSVTLHLLVCHLYCSLSLLEVYLRNQGLHYTYRCATLSAAYVCKLYLQNCWITLHVWVSNLESSLSLLALRTETLGSTTLISVPP